jgi:hypothetical protein
VAFDVDGTLIDDEDRWNLDVVSYAQRCFREGALIAVWSGGGYDYAEVWRGRLTREGIPAVRAYDKHYDLDRLVEWALSMGASLEMVDNEDITDVADSARATLTRVVAGRVMG